MKLLLKTFTVLLVLITLLIIVYLLGPKVEKPNLDSTLPQVPTDLVQLEKWINDKEATIPNIKPENEAKIIWADSVPAKTEYSIVYLHGWSASHMEGYPLHVNAARRYGCNLYLPRLAGHGLEEKEPMLQLTANDLLNAAKEAIAVAKQLGDKVIVMGTSAGGTLALHLAEADKAIAALLLYSPNIEIYDKRAKLLTKPWGLQLVKAIKGSNYHEPGGTEEEKKYWTPKYRIEALTHLQALVDYTMVPETFQKVKQPVFLGYFYKNDTIQDKTVSVPALLQMYDQLGTKPSLKRKVAFPNVGSHVMTSSITSQDLESVQRETYSFLENILKLKPL